MSFGFFEGRMTKLHLRILAVVLLFALSSCSSPLPRFLVRMFSQIPAGIETVENKIANPLRQNVGLSVLWVGHATVLIQIHDKVFITDPIFTNTVGMIAKRLVEPGIDPTSLSKLDYTLISHIHLDHFSYASLDDLPKDGKLVLPFGGLSYTPEFGFKETRELRAWEVMEEEGVRITAVPVRHFAGRYGFDTPWMRDRGFTGYVIEYRGSTIFFGGDTGYDSEIFKEIGRKFSIDVALIPISPIEPRDFMQRVHVDPNEAVQVFEDLQAKILIPMHHRTFVQGFDAKPTTPQEALLKIVDQKGLQQKVIVLAIGEQRILTP